MEEAEMTAVATKQKRAVEPEIVPGKTYWLTATLATGNILPGDRLSLEVREPEEGDYAYEKIGSSLFFGQVWKSRTRGLMHALFLKDGTYDKRHDSMTITPDTVLLVVTGLTRMLKPPVEAEAQGGAK